MIQFEIFVFNLHEYQNLNNSIMPKYLGIHRGFKGVVLRDNIRRWSKDSSR